MTVPFVSGFPDGTDQGRQLAAEPFLQYAVVGIPDLTDGSVALGQSQATIKIDSKRSDSTQRGTITFTTIPAATVQAQLASYARYGLSADQLAGLGAFLVSYPAGGVVLAQAQVKRT